MFDTVKSLKRVDRATYEQRLPELRVELLNAQFDLREADFPVVVLVAGNDRIGCNEAVRTLHEWMDARYLPTYPFVSATEEERERPRFWRYWRVLPRRGQMALLVGGWAHGLIGDRVRRRLNKKAFDRQIEHAIAFERSLANEGTLLLKFWLHLEEKDLEGRLERARNDPDENWRVTAMDAALYERWDEVMPVADRFVTSTHTEQNPWQVISSGDTRTRSLRIAESVLEALRSGPPKPPAAPAVPDPTDGQPPPALESADLTTSTTKARYEKDLPKWQRRLRRLVTRARKERLSPVLVFEGWDAAGKGGAIRRITAALDVTDYRVVPIAAPNEAERNRHYLWRFWTRLPRDGHVLIFDRSWYGRVLVERVEGFAAPEAWTRAYEEIRDFESQLTESGSPLLKFWLHIDPSTQLERFQARETTPYKKYKITDDDYRNRGRWEEYVGAVDRMIAETSTKRAPWHVVPANDKRSARITVLKTICRALEKALDK